LLTAIINGLMTGAVYALVALGLTLIYGVLHIINFAHGALLSAALFAAFFAFQKLGLDPYFAAFLIAPAFFALGYCQGSQVQSECGDCAHCESLCDTVRCHGRLLLRSQIGLFWEEIMLTACSPSAGKGGSGGLKAATVRVYFL
jgi:hypothetical protein